MKNDSTIRPESRGDIIELGVASIDTQGSGDKVEPMGPGDPPGVGIADE